MKLRSIEVEILVEDQPAREYTDQDFEQEPERRTISKYIEAIEGAHFAFRCKAPAGYTFAKAVDLLAFQYTVDGNSVLGSALPKQRHDRGVGSSTVRNGYTSIVGGLLKEERFRFGKIATTDDTIPKVEADRQKRQYEYLGELRVEVWRCAGSATPGFVTPLETQKDLSSVHQKVVSQTAVSMGTEKGAPIASPCTGSWSGKNLDKHPTATFIFKYRDRASLHKLRIIEASPTPVPLEVRGPATPTPDVVKETVRSNQAKEEEQRAKIKTEEAEEARHQPAGLKREKEEDDKDDLVLEVENPYKKVRIEVIELSDDD